MRKDRRVDEALLEIDAFLKILGCDEGAERLFGRLVPGSARLAAMEAATP
jgi:hypothetical protein